MLHVGYLALLARQFPGSWLPFGSDQVIRCARPHLELVASTSGRLDYVETMHWVIPGMMLTLLGFQTILTSFFCSILGMHRR